VGKTRVALRAAAQLAEEFPDGTWLVELSGLHDAELLPDTVAAALGLPGTGLAGTGSHSQLDAILEHLRDQRLLLILDTCEHLIDACAMLADILLRATPVTVLATSRQPLAVPGEHIYVIPPLPVPRPGARNTGGDAVELFAQCAAAAVPGFEVTDVNRACVIRLCRRLDGVPLAIELATVRLRAIPLEQLVDRLEDRFRLLAGGRRAALPHHQTIRAATEWSYDLCSPAEQLLWARLSVFAGSFDVAAAEQVCADERLDARDVLATLIGLVDKSVLLRADGEGGTRYVLLDTIREFGAEKLAERGEQDMIRQQHLARYCGLAVYLGEHPLAGDQVPRYRQLRQEHAELRAALEYALTMPGRPRDAAAMAISLDAYWQMSSVPGEGRHWLGKVLPRLGELSRARAMALIVDGYLACLQDDTEDGLTRLDQGIAIAEERGDGLIRTRGYLNLTMALTFAGRYEEAARAGATAYEGALAAGDSSMLAVLDSHVGYLHLLAGEAQAGLARCRRGLARLGPDSGERWQQSYLRLLEGMCLFVLGDLGPSAEAFRTALAMKHEIGDTMGMGYALEGTGWLAAAERRFTRAAWLLGAAEGRWRLTGGRLGRNATAEALHARAEQLVRDALGEERYRTLHDQGAAYPLEEIVRLAEAGADALPPQPAEAGAALVPPPSPPVPALTSRELEIAGLVGQGLSNRQIAERLVISKRTVDAHIEHIYGKLGVSSRVQLASWLRSSQA
jgi:predicted ATPase/DNA-binding CsgD family transcriptional regulator